MMVVVHPVSKLPKAFSCQGHIELPRDYLANLYRTRRERIDAGHPGRAEQALKTLDPSNTSDDVLVGRWAVNFLRGVGESPNAES